MPPTIIGTVSHWPMCRPVAWAKADQLRIRLADELDAEAEQAVEKDEGADELARLIARLGPPEHEPEDREQHDALKPGFIQLAGVARRAEQRP